MLQVLVSAFLALIAVGCSGPRYVDYFPYHDNGTPKPRVALMTMIDSSNSGLPWNISEEISQAIDSELMNHGNLYVLTPQEIGPVWNRQETIDFFGNNMNYLCDFQNTDFIVVIDLIEHSTKSCESKNVNTNNQTLLLKARVKVIDIRFDQPRVILYEIMKSSFMITQPYKSIDYNKVCWKSEGYQLTPCSRVHQRLEQCIAARLEEVICSAR